MPLPSVTTSRLIIALLLAALSVPVQVQAGEAAARLSTAAAADIPQSSGPAPRAGAVGAAVEAAGKKPPLVVPETCLGYHVDDPRWFDRAQGYFSVRACTPAVWFDRFFGSDRVDEDVATALVRVIPSIQYSDRDFTAANVRFKARVSLPNLKDRYDIVVNDSADERSGLLPGEVARPQQAGAVGQETSAALRYLLRKADQSSTDVDVGLRAQLKFFARLRYVKAWTHSPVLQTRYTQAFYFRDGDGFGESSLYEVERMLAEDVLLRWSNQLSASEETAEASGMQWRDGVMLLRQIDRDRAVSLNLAMTADSEPAWKASGYYTSVRYRQRAFRPWFFFEIEPFVDAIRADRFNTNPGIAFRVELWLGDDGSKAGAPPAQSPQSAAPVLPAPDVTSPTSDVPTTVAP